MGWLHFQLMNARGEFASSVHHLRLWPTDVWPSITPQSVKGFARLNPLEKDPEVSVKFRLPTSSPIFFGSATSSRANFDAECAMFSESLLKLCPILHPVPMPFSADLSPDNLPAMLLILPWQIPSAVLLAHAFLKKNPLPPQNTHVALRLLSYEFPDAAVRSYAVQYLTKLQNSELLEFSIPLVQAIKFEPYLNSSLAKLLVTRALENPSIASRVLSHPPHPPLPREPLTDFSFLSLSQLCWHIKTEMEVSKPWYRDRYVYLLKALFMLLNEELKRSLLRQIALVADLSHLGALLFFISFFFP